MTGIKAPVHQDLTTQLFAAHGARAEVAAAAEHLAKLMQSIHGGAWRIQIEHSPEATFVLVVPRPETKIRKEGCAS